MTAGGIKSYFVCERCGTVHRFVLEPGECSKCSSLSFAWFQSEAELEGYVARFTNT